MEDKDTQEVVPAVQPTTALQIIARAPEGMAEADQSRVRKEAEDLVDKIGKSLNDRSSILSLDELGNEEVDDVGKSVEMVETRINRIVRLNNDQHDSIPDKITTMRRSVDELNPKRTEQNTFARIVSAIPGGGVLVDWWWKSGLRQMALKRETVRQQIKGIRDSLQGNRDQLREDNKQLAGLYGYVHDGSLMRLQRKAFLLELLAGKLMGLHDSLQTDDPLRDRVRMALEKVTHRARSMRLYENALTQALASIDITINGNDKVAEGLDEAAVLVPSYLTPLMALYQALAHQAQGTEVLRKTQEGVGEVISRTSELTREGAAAADEAYYNLNGLVAKVGEAQRNLIAAFEEIEVRSRQGFLEAQRQITQLQANSAELRERQLKLHSVRQLAEAPSRR